MAFPYSKRLRKIDLPDPYLKCIALIALEWSRLETIIEETIWVLTELGPGVGGNNRGHIIGRALTTHMPFKQRIDAIKSLLHEIFGDKHEATEEFLAFAKQIDKLRIDRNLIIHGEWMFDPSAPFIIERSARHMIKKRYRLPKLEALSELHNSIENSANTLRDWSLGLLTPVLKFYGRGSYIGPP